MDSFKNNKIKHLKTTVKHLKKGKVNPETLQNVACAFTMSVC